MSDASGHGSNQHAPLASAGRAVNAWSPEYIEQMHAAWKADPSSVGDSWNQFFLGFELGLDRPAASADTASTGGADPSQSKVDALIEGYRRLGHLGAQLDPLGTVRPMPKELALSEFGLTGTDLPRTFSCGTLPIGPRATLADIVSFLQTAYCGAIGAEFGYVSCPRRRAWLAGKVESAVAAKFDAAAKERMLAKLVAADGFENFLATRFIGKKRFGLEGGEALLVVLDHVLGTASAAGADECVLGMAHRGRLNVLHNVAGKPAEMIFTEFEEAWAPHFEHGGGDVKYHQGFSGDYPVAAGAHVRVSLCANPSHLEFVGPVALGRARARQERTARTLGEGRAKVLPILLHGDAALPGQGVVAETMNMAALDGYDVGGTVHVVINNQVGFTTDSRDSYAGPYCTNVARTNESPVFHVNGGEPEACALVARIAAEWRAEFGEDAFIDIWCWRKNGHNETDEPNFTQPLLYRRVRAAKPVAARYAERLVQEGVIPADGLEARNKALFASLDTAQARAKEKPVEPGHAPFGGEWKGMTGTWSDDPVETGVSARTLKALAAQLASIPEGFAAHKTVAKGVQSRAIESDGPVEWALAELLAYASLVEEGDMIRITGQDVKRGTFSHRHAALFNQETGEEWCALRHLKGAKGRFEIFNSPLTECACVGFEYGYSLVDPRALVIWEGQFGDFANGAQVMFDQFMAAAEAKWFRSSGLTLFLPHGYEGQGPEHSSARMERFLQLAAEDNIQVAYPSTTAQLFHVLRRQLKRSFRKPLVVMTPKSMLRLPAAQSPLAEFQHGHFQAVIGDPAKPDASKVKRVVFCTGKLFHELDAARQESGNGSVALVRIEQLTPFPAEEVKAQAARYKGADLVWAQEEPENMGAWSSVLQQFLRHLGKAPAYAGRPEQASPAVGSLKRHGKEQAKVVALALGTPAMEERPAGKARGEKAH
jgi:2-oxoglutarate dehydrogenase E1 component